MLWSGCCNGTSRWRAPSRPTRRCGSITQLRTGAGAVSRCAYAMPDARRVEPERDQAAWRLRHGDVAVNGWGSPMREGVQCGRCTEGRGEHVVTCRGMAGLRWGSGLALLFWWWWRRRWWRWFFSCTMVDPNPIHNSSTQYRVYRPNRRSLWTRREEMALAGLAGLACPMRGAKSREPGNSFFLWGLLISHLTQQVPTATVGTPPSQSDAASLDSQSRNFNFQRREI